MDWAGIDRTRARVAARLHEQVSPDDGAVRARCESRVLESALLLLLLRRAGLMPGAQEQLTRYLDRRRQSSFHGALAPHSAALPMSPSIEVSAAFDMALINVTLSSVSSRSEDQSRDRSMMAQWLHGFSHETGSRKKLLLQTVLALFDLVPHNASAGADMGDYRGFASWTELALCAIHIMHRVGVTGGISSPRARTVPPRDREFLLAALRKGEQGPVAGGHLLAHILALHALHLIEPDHPLVARGATRVMEGSNSDGGIPFVIHMTVTLTAATGSALAGTGAATPDHIPALLRMGRYVSAQQKPDGGWSYTEGTEQSDVDDTYYCATFLRQLSRKLSSHQFTGAIARAARYMQETANPDGGLPTYRKGHASEATMTAGAILVLASLDPPDSTADSRDAIGNTAVSASETLSRATTYLLAAQHDDGTFERSWSLAETNSIQRSVDALSALLQPGRLHPTARLMTGPGRQKVHGALSRAAHYLRTAQNPDGGWGHTKASPSDVLSTSYAVAALASPALCDSELRTLQKGLTYLLAGHEADGTYISIPDQGGPRPLPYDFPIVPNIFALQALNSARACFRSGSRS
ncbi:prenyltransferase/squalene oxidase repeat-containing protein [Streptomyces qinzhouensis]|uniref:Terpene cyclase/mutase family protein n=1 Tax=Streptomyces qinzhouensis TaxID=2599401 RepID=A0A5B8JDR7_9ACTN|nr:prenyltransferase/squalene oxidase repeat-containing protein [Streptomyces qinzhouensis]QDY79875.1 terpene cyclase/mutase family protein [Streptomyces qinzhouensis]